MGLMDRLTSPRQHAPSRREERREMQKQYTMQQQQGGGHSQGYGDQGYGYPQGGPQDMRGSKESQYSRSATSPHSPRSRSAPLHRGRSSGTMQKGQSYSNQGYPSSQQHYASHGGYPPQAGPPAGHSQGGAQETGQSTRGFFKSLMSFAPGRSSKQDLTSSTGPEGATTYTASAQPGAGGSTQGGAEAGGRGYRDAPPAGGTGGGSVPSGQGQHGRNGGPPGSTGGGGNDSAMIRDMKHRISVMESQLQELDELKRKLSTEQRSAVDWRDRWNFQNVKLNVMVDMLVLKMFEEEGGLMTGAGTGGPTSVQPTAPQLGTAPRKISGSS